MSKLVDYYFSPMSPWTYLGHARFEQIAGKAGADIHVKPVDFGRIFPVSGGLPLAKRAPQRQAYRLMELQRWRDHLRVPLNLHPKFFPVDTTSASLLIVATTAKEGQAPAFKLAGALLRAVWVDERNLAEIETLKTIVREQGLSEDLIARAQTPEAKGGYDSLTQEATDRQVFGAPTYVYKDELFWGQDRLEFLERALAR
jgi:2-hydroxychromene-2-carboxylate isomerase